MATPLDDWLTRIEQAHPQVIDLGLERVARVWRRLGAPAPAERVITVGGTNGKGSTVAFLDAAACAAGLRTGTYTSPHLLHYNERITLAGVPAGDEAIIAAFERIQARQAGERLTWFEFGTLAALLIMADAGLDLAILEVGLGGRLDAVNIIDADVAIVTTVALDHGQWLGHDRASVGREKAGIARAGRPLIVGERDAEPALLASAADIGARVLRLGLDYDWVADDQGRRLRCGDGPHLQLPRTLPLPAPCQWDNAASALAALSVLPAPDGAGTGAPAIPDLAAAAAGLARAQLPGRLQRLSVAPELWLDIGHNPQAAGVLADWLQGLPAARTEVVFSALDDKDLAGIVAPLLPLVSRWHLVGLDPVTARGLPVDILAQRLQPLIGADRCRSHADFAQALAAARQGAGRAGRVLAYGSFFTAAQVLQATA